MKKTIKKFLWTATSLLAVLAVQLYGASPADAALSAAGPISAANGFPVWYRDTNGLTLELCTDPANGLCLADPVIAGNALSEQNGFGPEAFYWSADSSIPLQGGGQALLVMGLEAAYGTGNPAPGQEMVFTRIRIRIDAPADGAYTVTHPFGSKTYNVTAGTRTINDTVDIGTIPLAFNTALTGNIGPFLTAVSPAPPPGYIGNPLTLQTVAGSPTGNNFFRVEGPVGSNLNGNGNDIVETNRFAVSGKIFAPTLTSINVTPANPAITSGNTSQLTATALDQNGAEMIPAPAMTWASSNTAVATVNATGLVTGVSAGTAIITATSGAVSGQTVVTVESPAPVLTSIAIAPINPSVTAGNTQQFTATALDQNGTPLTVQPEFTWASGTPGTGTINPQGIFTAVTPGTSIITATSGTISGTTTVTVPNIVIPPTLTTISIIPTNPTIAVGNTEQFTAIGLDQNGTALAIQPAFTWSSDTTTTGTIDVNGIFSAISPGTTVISATSGTVSEQTSVTVNSAPPVDNIPPIITLNGTDPVSINVGEVYTDAGATASDGVDGTVNVTVSGLPINTGAAGTFTVTYTAIDTAGNTATKTRTINVIVPLPTPVLTSIEIIPSSLQITVGNTRQFTAIGLDQNGTALAIQPAFTWSSDTTTTGTIDASGLFTAVSAGTTLLTATSGAVSGQSTVTVNTPNPQLCTPFTVFGQVTNGALPVDNVNVVLLNNNSGAQLQTITAQGGFYTIETANMNPCLLIGDNLTITATLNNLSGTSTFIHASGALWQANISLSSALDTTPPVITIIGANPIDISRNNTYTDAGATATDDIDLNVNVVTSGAVDTAVIGQYTITYTATDTAGNTSTATRIVNVVAETPIPDTTPPVITINGTDPASVNVGDAYNDAGATATDNVDQTVNVVVTGLPINTGAAGTFTVTYTATDTAGNIATATRTVNVVTPTPTPVLTTISISPVHPTITVGSTQQLTAVGLDQNGTALAIQPAFTWASGTTVTGTIDANGLFTALSAGTTVITATSGAINGNTTVTVSADQPVIDKIEVEPKNPHMTEGDTLKLSAEAKDENNNRIIPDPDFTWSSSDDEVATINTDGLVTAHKTGTARITATSGSVSGYATITVEAAPPVDNIPPIITLNGTDPVSINVGEVYTDAGATATDNVDQTVNVVVTGLPINTGAAGTFTVTYTAIDTAGNTATKTRTVNVVTPTPTPVLTTISISPTNPKIKLGETQQFTATGLDQNGTPLATQPTFNWTSLTAATGTIDENGLFTAASEGTSEISVSSGDVTENTTITVSAKDEDSILTTIKIPKDPKVTKGSTIKLSAVLLDQKGKPMKKPQVITWSSDNPQIVEVDSQGNVTGKSAGKATITATSQTVTATTVVDVTETAAAPNPVLTQIVISPQNPQVLPGKTQKFNATGLDQNGAPLIPQPTFSWTSSDAKIGSISADGLFSAVTPGTVTITATSGTITITSSVTVTDNPTNGGENGRRGDNDKKKKKNTPVSVKAPSSVKIFAGERVTWKAKSENGIVEHKVIFMGKTVKQKDDFFTVPASTPPGKYHLKIRSIDKSQRTASEGITIHVMKK